MFGDKEIFLRDSWINKVVDVIDNFDCRWSSSYSIGIADLTVILIASRAMGETMR